MKIETFWVVTRATPTSELSDVLFKSDAAGLVRHGRGGLDPADVIGIYSHESEAEREANAQIAVVRRAAR